MMARVLHPLLTLLVCIALMPGWVEALENLDHLWHDGHLAHVAEHGDGDHHVEHAVFEAEHGCTPANHTCACHISIPVVLPADAPLDPPAATELARRPIALVQVLVQRANAPPLPPPIARA